jgi:RES domain-containing protein
VQVFRITASRYAADLSGEGARRYGGRWNPPGIPVLYTAESLPLAALETLVNLPADFLSTGIFSRVTIEFPDQAPLTEVAQGDLPADWCSYPAPAALAEIGRKWFDKGEFLGLRVPAVVVGGAGWNILINPRHPDFSKVRGTEIAPFQFDTRLLKA